MRHILNLGDTLGDVWAFLVGAFEFKRDMTTHFDGDRIEAYDCGREFMHRATCRRYEP